MKATTVLSSVAILSMGAQPAQAGFVAALSVGAALIGIAGQAAGTAVRYYTRRDTAADTNASEETVTLQAAPPGVPQFEFDRCYADIAGRTITMNTNNVNYLEIIGLPPTCMNLANVLVGDGTGPFALPCGSDCLMYNSLTAGQIVEFQDALGI